MGLLAKRNGTEAHLFFGHGATQHEFDKRDFGTSNELFYEKKMKTETLINPHFYHGTYDILTFLADNKKIDTF